MNRRNTVLFLGILIAASAMAQRPLPGAAQHRRILLTGGVVHVGDGRVIEDGAVGFAAGVLDHVGFSYGVKGSYDTTIHLNGAHVYPGFILPDNTLGLGEVDAVRATLDEQETGDLTPEVRAISAYDTDSRILPTVRANGVLLAQVAPRGGDIAGTSSVVQLDAWDPDDAAVRVDDGIHLSWPPAFRRGGWWAEPGPTSRSGQDEREARIATIRTFFQRAKAHAADRSGPYDLRLKAMAGLFTGERTLYVKAERVREIQEVLAFVRDMGVPKLVIVGGYDAWRVAEPLRERKVDVILGRVHALPMRNDDPVDLPYRLPALLKERGVRFCLSYAGDMERMGGRNLPFLAGTAAAYGLTKEEALRAITLDAAHVLGIADRYGSLEPGKSATLFVSTGDALDMRTNDVRIAFVDGRSVVLDDDQKQLYRQYRDRYKERPGAP